MGRSKMEPKHGSSAHDGDDDDGDLDEVAHKVLGSSWRSMNPSSENGRLCERVLSSMSSGRGGNGNICGGRLRQNGGVMKELYLDNDDDDDDDDNGGGDGDSFCSGRHLLMQEMEEMVEMEEEMEDHIVMNDCSTSSDTTSSSLLSSNWHLRRRRRRSMDRDCKSVGSARFPQPASPLPPISPPLFYTPEPPPHHGSKLTEHLSEIKLMKERFAKLLLGEDMSGGAKGVSSALAISNAITNLSASVFGEMWRLEPLCAERKRMWTREMEWLLAVADHVVEFVPSSQSFPDGHGDLEVMVSRARSDLQINLPALRKLDAMLLGSLETFNMPTEFWYIDQDYGMSDHEDILSTPLLHRQEEKWWLPSPKVPNIGLSNETIKHLKVQRERINQVLKATLSINNQTLSEMEVPDVYWENLPKTCKASVGDHLYKHITSQSFVPETIVGMLKLRSDHEVLEVVNRLEEAIHVCRRKRQLRSRSMRKVMPRHTLSCGATYYHHYLMNMFDGRASWGNLVRDFMLVDLDRREFLASRAEILLLTLHRHFPNLPQSLLDRLKIQYNKDVGQSILESYSRVLESLASNIIARIDDVLHVDSVTKTSNLK